MGDVYTATLASGLELSMPVAVSFGEIIVTGCLLCFCSALALEFIFKWVYRE